MGSLEHSAKTLHYSCGCRDPHFGTTICRNSLMKYAIFWLCALISFGAIAQPSDQIRKACRDYTVEVSRHIVDTINDYESTDEKIEKLYELKRGANPLRSQGSGEKVMEHMIFLATQNLNISREGLATLGYSFCLSNSY